MPIVYTAFDPDDAEALPRLITIQKGALLHRFTDWTESITIDAVKWQAEASTVVKTLLFRTNGDVSMSEILVSASADNLIKQTDAVNGKYRGGTCTIEECGIANGVVLGKQLVMSGYIGPIEEVRAGDSTLLSITVNGQLAQAKGTQQDLYSANCIFDLGDDRCRVPILPKDQTRGKVYVTKANASTVDGASTGFATRVSDDGSGDAATYNNVYYEAQNAGTTHATTQPTYPTTPDDTIVDGGVTFICRDAFTRVFTIGSLAANGIDVTCTAVPDTRAVDGWYTEGYAIIRSGLNPGLLIPIANWVNATATFTSWDDLTLYVQAGDVGEIIAGCDKRRETCFSKFNNIINFGGWGTFAPGRSLGAALA